MQKINYLNFVILFLVLISCKVYAENCVFNTTYKNENPIQNSSAIKTYQWNSKAGELFAVLKEGEFIYVKKWSCDHLGMDARLIEFYSTHGLNEQDYWINKSLWLARQLFNIKDYQLLEQAIRHKKYTYSKQNDEIQFTIASDTYSTYTLTITEKDYMNIVSLYYYTD